MYNYQTERPRLFTDEGFSKILETRDRIHRLIKVAGCCTVEKAMCDGDSWEALAAIDYLIEKKEITRIPDHDILFLTNS